MSVASLSSFAFQWRRSRRALLGLRLHRARSESCRSSGSASAFAIRVALIFEEALKRLRLRLAHCCQARLIASLSSRLGAPLQLRFQIGRILSCPSADALDDVRGGGVSGSRSACVELVEGGLFPDRAEGLSGLVPRPASVQAAVTRMISSCSRAAPGP